MKKMPGLILIALLLAVTIACSPKELTPKETPPQQVQPDQQPQPPQPGEEGFRPSIGGIKRGDSKDQLLAAFGTRYEEDTFEEEVSLGEPFARLSFPNGITAIVGIETNKVLEIETNSADTVTNLGFKVGDDAREVLAKYRTMYQEPQSRHSDDTLIGWFLLQDEELIIFNFDQDEVLVNDPQLKPDAKVKRIKLSNFDYMD